MRNQSDKNRFLEKLATTPIVSAVCRNTSISKATIYRWLEKDEKFKEKFEKAMLQGRGSMNDLAESVLISLIKDKNIRATEYWLTNNHDTYYRPKKPQDYYHRYLGVSEINYAIVPVKKYDANWNEVPPTSESPPSPS